MIYNQLKEDIGLCLRNLYEHKKEQLSAVHFMPEHIHMMVSLPPKISVANFMGYLKGKSALEIFDKHANVKYNFGNRYFWAIGYYLSTVGYDTQKVRNYTISKDKKKTIRNKMNYRM